MGAMSILDGFRPVSFDWKAGQVEGCDPGLIAEDVADVVPEAVAFEADGVTPRGLKYDKFATLAMAGVKEQADRLRDAQRLIADLREQLAAMKSDLTALTRLAVDEHPAGR